jgi:hypothetical protein
MVSQIQVSVAKVDDELKKLAVGYNEKVQTLSTVQRKKTTNLVTSELEDFLTVETVNNNEFLDSDYLLTVLCVVPGQSEKGELLMKPTEQRMMMLGLKCICFVVYTYIYYLSLFDVLSYVPFLIIFISTCILS